MRDSVKYPRACRRRRVVAIAPDKIWNVGKST
jgi:hypothetical protein